MIHRHEPFLYRWTELSTGKWYIGSRTAKVCHPDDGYICSSKIVKPLILANPSGWKREILCFGSAEYIRDLEVKYLHARDAMRDPCSFNRTNGAKSFVGGVTHSPETRSKMSAAAKGRTFSPETCAKISAAKKGKTASPEARSAMSAAKKGKPVHNKGKKCAPLSQDHKDKISDANKGRKRSPLSQEHKDKLSAAKQGRKRSPEHQAKINAANKGRKRSPEACAAMSAAAKGRTSHKKGKTASPEAKTNMAVAQKARRATEKLN